MFDLEGEKIYTKLEIKILANGKSGERRETSGQSMMIRM
jgi:hypothetical protein